MLFLGFDSELEQILPPTDSRLRKDRFYLEKGDSKSAAAEKHRLEEKQRAERRHREKIGEEYKARYFKLANDVDGQTYWQYLGGYFEGREQRIKALQEKNSHTPKPETDSKS